SLGIASGAVVVTAERSDGVWRAARNVERVHVVTPNGLNLLDVLRMPRLVLTESAVAVLVQTLTADLKPLPPGETAAPAAGEVEAAAEETAVESEAATVVEPATEEATEEA